MTPPRMEYRPPRTRQRPLLPDGRAQERVFVAIEGPIGVGKTTLARLLAESLGAEVVLEVVEENPFLPQFYQDIRAYAFQTQIFFFLSRYRQQDAIRRAHERGRPVVGDYVFAKDRLFARMNLDPQELDLYDRLFELISPMTVQPVLVVYLRARLATLLRRIAHRDRPFERAIEPAYLERLSQEYDAFFESYEDAPVLRIDTDEVDILAKTDVEEILGYVGEAGAPSVRP